MRKFSKSYIESCKPLEAVDRPAGVCSFSIVLIILVLLKIEKFEFFSEFDGKFVKVSVKACKSFKCFLKVVQNIVYG